MGRCYYCGDDGAEMWDNDDRRVCFDCWIAPPGEDSFSRFIRETTDTDSDNNESDEP